VSAATATTATSYGLVSRLRAAGRKARINDSWIAATAIAYRVPLVTQDSDYDAMPDVQVIRI
jgi:hypothetical protein